MASSSTTRASGKNRPFKPRHFGHFGHGGRAFKFGHVAHFSRGTRALRPGRFRAQVSKVCAPIHDAVLTECPITEVEQHKADVKRIMVPRSRGRAREEDPSRHGGL